MTRTVLLLALAVAPVCSANSNYTVTKTQTWQFAPGGHIELHVKGGDVRVVRAADANHIAIRYTMESKHEDFARKVKPEFNVAASNAELRFRSPNNGSVDVELEVPEQTNIYIRTLGGDVTVSGVEGDEDLQTMGGDIRLDLPAAASFYRVDASTHFGDIDDSPFGQPKGWLGGKIHYRGDGKYRLHAHTFAGDISFSTLSASR
jgi:hypothetical protein